MSHGVVRKSWLLFVPIAALGENYSPIGKSESGYHQMKNSISIWASSTLKNMVRGYTVA